MSNIYSKFGLRDGDVQGAMAWEHYARKNGLSRRQIEDGLRWYGRVKDDVVGWDGGQLAASFLADHQGTWTQSELNSAAAFHDEAVTHGGYETLLPNQKEARERLMELEKESADPDSDYYGNPDKQAEHLALLEQTESNAVKTFERAASDGVAQLDGDRLRELDAMSADSEGEYYRGVNAAQLQSEHGRLIEAQQTGAQQTNAFAADAAPNEGVNEDV